MNYISYLRFPRKYLKYHRVWNSGFSKCIGLFTGLGTFNKKNIITDKWNTHSEI